MARLVEVAGIGLVEFPDDMPEADIGSAIESMSAAQAKPAPSASKGTSLLKGAEQGMSAGFSDEAAGVRRGVATGGIGSRLLAAMVPFAGPLLQPSVEDQIEAAKRAQELSQAEQFKRGLTGDPSTTFRDEYRAGRDVERGNLAAASKSHPGYYLGGEIAGAVASAGRGAAAKGAPILKRIAVSAGQGALQGAGYSDATTAAGIAGDSALGAGLGTAGYAVGQGLGRAASWLTRKGASLVARGTQRAADQAEKEVAEQLASAAGKTGAEVQKGSRFVENLMRLEESMTPEQRAVYAQLQAAGVIPGLQRAVAQSTLDSLPSQAGAIAARKAELAALQQAAPEAISSRANELLTPQVKADTKSFLKSYAEPLIWAYAGNKAAELAGADPEQRMAAAGVAGLVGGRTRAGKALWNRLSRPAHQVALGRAMESAGEAGQGTGAQLLRALFTRGLPAAATAGAVAPAGSEQER